MGLLYQQTDRPWSHPRRTAGDGPPEYAADDPHAEKSAAGSLRGHAFFAAEILAWLIAKKKISARHVIAVTDYDVHASWLCRTVDRYYVAIEESQEYLARIGVPREKLRVAGIPIDPLFEKPVSASVARQKTWPCGE